MKITLDQQTLAQAVTAHLRSNGVTADIAEVNFRYNRSPFSVFAEVELSEARVAAKPIPARVIEKERVVAAEPAPVPAPVAVPIVDPATVPPEVVEPEAPRLEVPSSPLFSSGE